MRTVSDRAGVERRWRLSWYIIAALVAIVVSMPFTHVLTPFFLPLVAVFIYFYLTSRCASCNQLILHRTAWGHAVSLAPPQACPACGEPLAQSASTNGS